MAVYYLKFKIFGFCICNMYVKMQKCAKITYVYFLIPLLHELWLVLGEYSKKVSAVLKGVYYDFNCH